MQGMMGLNFGAQMPSGTMPMQGGMPMGPMQAAGMQYMGQPQFMGMTAPGPQYMPDMQKQLAEEHQKRLEHQQRMLEEDRKRRQFEEQKQKLRLLSSVKPKPSSPRVQGPHSSEQAAVPSHPAPPPQAPLPPVPLGSAGHHPSVSASTTSSQASALKGPSLEEKLVSSCDLSASKQAQVHFKSSQPLAEMGHKAPVSAHFQPSTKARNWGIADSNLRAVFTVEAPPPSPLPASTLAKAPPPANETDLTVEESGAGVYPQQEAIQPMVPGWLYNDSLVPDLFKKVLEITMTPSGIDTAKLYPILMSSGLPREALGQIWASANRTTPGKLTKEELYTVLAMIGVTQRGLPAMSLDILTQFPSAPVPNLSGLALVMPGVMQQQQQHQQQPMLSMPSVPQPAVSMPLSTAQPVLGVNLPMQAGVLSTQVSPGFMPSFPSNTQASEPDDDDFQDFQEAPKAGSADDSFTDFQGESSGAFPIAACTEPQNRLILEVINKANDTLNGISSSSVCTEVIQSAQGMEYLLGVVEVYRVVRRVELGIKATAVCSDKLQQLLKDINRVWHNLIGFMSLANLSVDDFKFDPFGTFSAGDSAVSSLASFDWSEREEPVTNRSKKPQPSFFTSEGSPASATSVLQKKETSFGSAENVAVTTSGKVNAFTSEEASSASTVEGQFGTFADFGTKGQGEEEEEEEEEEDDFGDFASTVSEKSDTAPVSGDPGSDTTQPDDFGASQADKPKFGKFDFLMASSQAKVKSSEEMIRSELATFDLSVQGVVEVYRVVRRVELGIKATAVCSDKLQQLLKDINRVWHNLIGFMSLANLSPDESSLDFSSCILRHGIKNAKELACGVCLLSVDSRSKAFSSETDSFKLMYGGHQYHASCANFWINCVEPKPPGLILPDLL
ncbi:UNVERIFIED_CONTAM: hypothetical protein FKN15_021831 [Acipenser sinensis]